MSLLHTFLAVTVATDGDSVLSVVPQMFSKGDTLTRPEHLVPLLEKVSIVWAIIFLTAGLTTMLNGYKFYKWVTVALCASIGIFAGYQLGLSMNAPPHIFAACLGILLAVVALPAMKYAVAAVGGLIGAFFGANCWAALAYVIYKGENAKAVQMAENHWIGALLGLVLCGLLAFILFKLSVVLFTSVSGSTIAVLGGAALLLQTPMFQESTRQSMLQHRVVIPLLVTVPAVIGLILQQSRKDSVTPPGGAAKKPEPKPA